MKVTVCRSGLLLPTETFIKDQVCSYQQWQATLAGFERVSGGLSLEQMDVRLLRNPSTNRLQTRWRELLNELWLTPSGPTAALRSLQSDLLHVHFGTDAVVFWPLLRRLRLPMVVTLHGYDINIDRRYWERTGLRPSNRRYPTRLLALSRNLDVHFVAVSEAIRTRAIEFGLPRERLAVCHIGIDPGRFAFSGIPPSQRRRRILFTGRLVEKKGVEYLIRAFARLRSHVPDAELAIVGNGPRWDSLHRLAAELDVPVDFRGGQSRDEVKKELDLARVFCLPSVTAANGDAEGFGMVLLEAQSSGVPVVTSARGGATEAILNGKTGWAVPEKDVETLAGRLRALLTDDALVDDMSARGITHVARRFDVRACTRRLESLYDSILKGQSYADAGEFA